MSEFITSFSAALAVWGLGTAGFGAWRLSSVWGQDARRTILLAGAVLVALGLGTHQAMAWWAHETGVWRGAPASPIIATAYRLAWAAGLLALAGAASWPRCGHRGWLGLLALGGLAWLVAWAI